MKKSAILWSVISGALVGCGGGNESSTQGGQAAPITSQYQADLSINEVESGKKINISEKYSDRDASGDYIYSTSDINFDKVDMDFYLKKGRFSIRYDLIKKEVDYISYRYSSDGLVDSYFCQQECEKVLVNKLDEKNGQVELMFNNLVLRSEKNESLFLNGSLTGGFDREIITVQGVPMQNFFKNKVTVNGVEDELSTVRSYLQGSLGRERQYFEFSTKSGYLFKAEATDSNKIIFYDVWNGDLKYDVDDEVVYPYQVNGDLKIFSINTLLSNDPMPLRVELNIGSKNIYSDVQDETGSVYGGYNLSGYSYTYNNRLTRYFSWGSTRNPSQLVVDIEGRQVVGITYRSVPYSSAIELCNIREQKPCSGVTLSRDYSTISFNRARLFYNNDLITLNGKIYYNLR